MLEKYINRDCKFSPREELHCPESSDEELTNSRTQTPTSMTDDMTLTAQSIIAKPDAAVHSTLKRSAHSVSSSETSFVEKKRAVEATVQQ